LQHSEVSRQNDLNKEVIRRLKIQNKKLIEQVASLRERLKMSKSERNSATAKLNELLKLNHSLSVALEWRKK
jgi:hypothetical protein